MLDALSHFVLERRQGLTRAAGYVGSAYFVSKYVVRSLQETRDAVLQERIAREKYALIMPFV